MSYLGLDPAGPFEKCDVCGEPMDYTKSYDHRECIPKIQVIGWYECKTCNRWPWDCSCPQWAECTECECQVDDIDGPTCSESADGFHHWKVQDADGCRYLNGKVPEPYDPTDEYDEDQEATSPPRIRRSNRNAQERYWRGDEA